MDKLEGRKLQMIARGFKPVAWVAAIGVAALSCYMLSLRVASERAELASLDQRIIATRQAIRSLQTELGTRGRLQQLEQWNAEVLALSAPVAGQFVESNVSLARFDTRTRDFADQSAEVRLASAATGQAPAPATAQPSAPATRPAATPTAPPRVILAAAGPQDGPKPIVASPTVQRAAPTVQRVALVTPPARTIATTRAPERAAAPRPTAERQPVAQRPAATRQTVAARTVPTRSPSLLGDDVLRDLRTEARAERTGGTRN
jgi:hypothetical protein